ncbi:hypothetical protein [Shewanella sp. T24-MNA-CIBAN-0130]|uniref:hypothetical protein n=1 Tax=Shewanella sp. T24-MNA-CIBAN-0130 TaxID=3140470 RepID=UPI00332F01AD
MNVKLAPEPKYKKLYSISLQSIKALELENAALKDKVYTLSGMVLSGKVGSVVVQDGILDIDVPKHVAEWMLEYGMPWQVFRCDDHGLWVTDLDCSFPYHMEQSKCNKCERNEFEESL